MCRALNAMIAITLIKSVAHARLPLSMGLPTGTMKQRGCTRTQKNHWRIKKLSLSCVALFPKKSLLMHLPGLRWGKVLLKYNIILSLLF